MMLLSKESRYVLWLSAIRPSKLCVLPRRTTYAGGPRKFHREYHVSPAWRLQQDVHTPLAQQQIPKLARETVTEPSTSAAATTTTLETLIITTVPAPAPNVGVIKILSLNRPQARNAISRKLLEELGAEVERIHAEDTHTGAGADAAAARQAQTRVLIIASELDSCFCAGADLKERRTMSDSETLAFLHALRHTFTRLHALPIPSISAISSVALGGGLELALCTSLRVCAAAATLGLPEVRLAILPGAGGTFRLPPLVGPARARDLVLTGRRVDGRTAANWGLVDYLVDDERGVGARAAVLREALRVAGDVCRGAPLGVRAALRALRGAAEEEENRAYEGLLGTRDRREALEAFGARPARAPVFEGW